MDEQTREPGHELEPTSELLELIRNFSAVIDSHIARLNAELEALLDRAMERDGGTC